MSGLKKGSLRIPKTIKLFIGGAFTRTESGRSFPVHFHDGKELYANLCRASRKDLRNSVQAALKALPGWSGRTAFNRSQILYRMAEMTEGKRSEFVTALREVLGWDEKQAEASVDEAINAFVYFAGFADKYQQVIGAVNPVSGPHHNFTGAEPVGVVGLIAEENFDLGRFASQVAAIVSSGNTLVALLSEEGAALMAPLSEVLATSDLPAGAVNLLSGYVDELYSHFGSHMELQSLWYQGHRAEILGELKELGIDNMKRIFGPSEDLKSLEAILRFVEYKTVWHPIGS